MKRITIICWTVCLVAVGAAFYSIGVSLAAMTDDQFLERIQKKAVDYFLNESHETTGLVKDRAHNFGEDTSTTASVTAVGFALPAYIVGAERGFISREEAYRRTLTTLRFFRDRMPQHHGFYYHFVDMNTGERRGDSELSSIDTALFLAGALCAKEYFADSEVAELAQTLYERTEWPWMLNGGETFSMGWRPTRTGEGYFLKSRWKDYNETMILYLLAIGSPTHPVSAETWHAINRPVGRYGKHICIISTPLFTHQYSHIFIDFRNKHDAYADYFVNSRTATEANREFCIDHKDTYKTYGPDSWGLTACDGPRGYKAYGAKPGNANHDGTIAPTGAGGSIVFTPRLSIAALRNYYRKHKRELWGRYGFADSFNLDKQWFARDVVAIDQGALLLMIENYRSGLIWRYCMKNTALRNAVNRVGFVDGTKELEMPQQVRLTAEKARAQPSIDGVLDEWEQVPPIELTKRDFLEFGTMSGDDDCSAELKLMWDEKCLYVAARITDDDIYYEKRYDAIYKNDCLEIFVDPDGDGFIWNDRRDVQVGISPDFGAGDGPSAKTWAWFQKIDPRKKKRMRAAAKKIPEGYTLEAAVSWAFLRTEPRTAQKILLSVALHDADARDRSKAKFNVFFQDVTGKDGRKKLAVLELK